MNLRPGDRGEKVRVLQRALQRAGFDLKDDGDFGGITEAAVKAFQNREGLKVDGIAGSATLTTLGLNPSTLDELAEDEDDVTTITFTEEEVPIISPMPGLMDFLESQDIGVTSTGHSLHIGHAFLDTVATAVEVFEVSKPTLLALAEIEAGASAIGGATVSGVALAYTGPLLGLAGTFMALGSGYEEAREEIKNEAIASGFSQGFVAGILNMSASTTKSLFGMHGVGTRNVFDPESDMMKVNAHNRGLVAGYILANTATPEEKKAFVFELRKFVSGVSAGNWGDREKRDYVIAYSAKLRLHYLDKLI